MFLLKKNFVEVSKKNVARYKFENNFELLK